MQFGLCVIFSVLAIVAATGKAAQTSDLGPMPPRPTVDSMIDDILKGRASPRNRRRLRPALNTPTQFPLPQRAGALRDAGA